MRLTNVDRTVTLEHTPGAHWFLGGLFILVGAIAMLATLATTGNSALTPWERLASTSAGFTALITGTWVCWRSPRSHAVLDLASGLGRIERLGIGVRETTEFPLEVVEAVVLDQSKDDDGGDVYRPALRLRDGRLLPLTPVWLHHGPQDAVQQLARAIDRPVSRQALRR